MIDNRAQSSERDPETQDSSCYKIHSDSDSDSKLDGSILVQLAVEKGYFLLHIYVVIITNKLFRMRKSNIVDLRKKGSRKTKSPLTIIGDVKGSLSFTRSFIQDPAEKKYEEKLKEKYPNKKHPKKKRLFPPLLLLTAHYCQLFRVPATISKEELAVTIKEKAREFEDYIVDELNPTLQTMGRLLYLKGEEIILTVHLTRDLPKVFLTKLVKEELLEVSTNQPNYSLLVPAVSGMRKELTEQVPLLRKRSLSGVFAQIQTSKKQYLPLDSNRFPIIVVGEPTIRRTLILNILRNTDARYLVIDPKEQYGRLTLDNARVRGFLLGKSYHLNIISTEDGAIREQLYAYWFARIIAYMASLRTEIAKAIETYLLGAYKDPSNTRNYDLTFRNFATQELTSQVTKLTRNESSVVTNVLYPLSTYDEISTMTRVGDSPSIASLFETKGAVLQLSKEDEQLAKAAYLFTLLKLRAIKTTDSKILVLENIDDFIGDSSSSWRDSPIGELVLGLAENYCLVLGVRSPSKIQQLFINTKSKFINRLTIPADQRLLEKEYNISNSDIHRLNNLTDLEYFALLPEYANFNIIKVPVEEDTSMRVLVDRLQVSRTKRLLQSDNLLVQDPYTPETKKVLFELIRILREKPRQALPEEGIQQLLPDFSDADFQRAKELAFQNALIKRVEGSPGDSAESLYLLVLLDRGEKFYQEQLNLTKQIRKVNLKTRTMEQRFARDIHQTMEKITLFVESKESKSALELMVSVARKLLGALPEKERYVSGTHTGKLFQLWAHLSAIQEQETFNKALKLNEDFGHTVENTLKFIKEKTQQIQRKASLDISLEEKTSRKKRKKKKVVAKKATKKDSETEIVLDVIEEPKTYAREPEEPWEKSITRVMPEEKSDKEDIELDQTSHFVEATKDLRNAGLRHRASNGDFFDPTELEELEEIAFPAKKASKRQSSKASTKTVDPFAPRSKKNTSSKQSDEDPPSSAPEVVALKKSLFDLIAAALGQELDDEYFIWHLLTNRYKGALDDGYAISEIVTLIQELEKDSQAGKELDDSLLVLVENLLQEENLFPDKMLVDFRQYIRDAQA